MWNACKQRLMDIWGKIIFSQYKSFQYQSIAKRPIRLDEEQIVFIRQATASDCEAIYQTEYEAYDSKPPWNQHAFSVDLRYNERAVYFACEQTNQLIGFLGVRFVNNKELHVTNVAVRPSSRQMGVATHLFYVLDQFAKLNGVERVTLEVRKSNVVAQQMYHHLGYTIYGTKANYYHPDREDAIEMQKELME